MSCFFGCLALVGSMVLCSAAAVRVPLTVAEDAGVTRSNGQVTSGVPFPMGALPDNAAWRLVDEQGREVPLQSRITATWRDGSVKWALLDFQTSVAAGERRQFMLEAGDAVKQLAAQSLLVTNGAGELEIDTGPLKLVFSRNQPGFLGLAMHQTNLTRNLLEPSLILTQGVAQVLPPDELVAEESGPLRVVVKAAGWITDGSTNRLVRYVTRVTAFAGSPQLRVQHTITQLSDRHKMLWLRDHSLALPLSLGTGLEYAFGGNGTTHTGRLSGPVSLTQLVESQYRVGPAGGPFESGLKAQGWVNVQGTNGGLLVVVKDFWQQFPKALEVSPTGLRLGLYPGETPKAFDLDQGLAKTHELLLVLHPGDFSPERCAEAAAGFAHPLFAIAPTQWYCDTKVFGDLLPFDFDRFPDYETLTEASGDQFLKRMATGLRHWGDVYYGGEYKGTNSYMNLEYDMHHNFLAQFARTGQRKYLDTAFTMAQHQADIDTNHKTGWQWKHSPRHVEIQAEFGHTFTRGLLETYFLSGNRRCLEAALELGDYFAKDIRNPRALGNERQIGWALISLLPVYEATWDRKYFEAASNTVERLLAGLEPSGKFSIRWDNRIAFFNGIAATGFIYYYRATGDERVADAALRVLRRARGFYPEYNGRTLEAIAWAYQRTREPEWLDFLARTWETTMARQLSWNVMELGAPTIFTVHALPFMAQSGLLPGAEKTEMGGGETKRPPYFLGLTPAQFDTANGTYAHHLPSGEADLYLKREGSAPLDLVIIRKGAWKSSGAATLYDATGHKLAAVEFPKENVLWQRQVIPLPAAGGKVYRLALRSPTVGNVRGGSYVTWDVVTSRPAPAVFSTPEFRGLEFITPRLFAVPRGDAAKIELELAAEGEGFKRAVIYDPDGAVAGSVEGFIDLGDKGRYHYKVSADIPARHRDGLWSVSLQEVVLEKMAGLAPYFSTSQKSFFRPDHLAD